MTFCPLWMYFLNFLMGVVYGDIRQSGEIWSWFVFYHPVVLIGLLIDDHLFFTNSWLCGECYLVGESLICCFTKHFRFWFVMVLNSVLGLFLMWFRSWGALLFAMVACQRCVRVSVKLSYFLYPLGLSFIWYFQDMGFM